MPYLASNDFGTGETRAWIARLPLLIEVEPDDDDVDDPANDVVGARLGTS
jgi:hypothetical protein